MLFCFVFIIYYFILLLRLFCFVVVAAVWRFVVIVICLFDRLFFMVISTYALN